MLRVTVEVKGRPDAVSFNVETDILNVSKVKKLIQVVLAPKKEPVTLVDVMSRRPVSRQDDRVREQRAVINLVDIMARRG